MSQFYFRDGRALTDTQSARIQLGKRGDSGFITVHEPCSRCGGKGGSQAWAYTGWTCYRCGGKNSQAFEVRSPRVFTAKKLAKLNEAAERKEAKKRAILEATEARRFLEFVEWSKPHKKLLGDIAAATGNSFLANLSVKLMGKSQLTERQLEAAATAIKRQKQREVEGRASEYVGEIKKRIEFEAEVTGVYGTEGFYGHTDIVKCKDADGNQFTWFASDYTNLERGDRMTIKGTVKKHDEYRGIKQTVLTRCKYTKFETMTPDEAAQAEAVA